MNSMVDNFEKQPNLSNYNFIELVFVNFSLIDTYSDVMLLYLSQIDLWKRIL